MKPLYDQLYKQLEAYDSDDMLEKSSTRINEMTYRNLFNDIVETIVKNYPINDDQRNLLQQMHAYYGYWDADKQLPGFAIGAIWAAMSILDANEQRKQDEMRQKALKDLIENVQDFKTVLLSLKPNIQKTIQDLVNETHINEETILRIIVVFQQYHIVYQSIMGTNRYYSLTTKGIQLQNEV